MAELQLSERVSLRALTDADAEELYRVVDANRAHLARWMPWARCQTFDRTRDFIRSAAKQEEEAAGLQRALVEDGSIAGVLGYHGIDQANATTTIGYWLAEARQGRGLMTAAVGRLIEHAFDEWRLHRIEVRAAPDNHRSRALIQRLGFREEGVLREAERFGEQHRDLVLYSLLASERRGPSAPLLG